MTPHAIVYRHGNSHTVIFKRAASEAARNPHLGWFGFHAPDGPLERKFNPARQPGRRIHDYEIPADVRAAIARWTP